MHETPQEFFNTLILRKIEENATTRKTEENLWSSVIKMEFLDHPKEAVGQVNNNIDTN